MRLMMAMTAAVLAAGCSIVDPGDWDDLRQEIASLPTEALVSARQWAANRAAIERLEKEDPNLKLMGVKCHDDDGMVEDEEYDILVKDVLACLKWSPIAEYGLCLDDEARRRARGFYRSAEWLSLGTFGCDYIYTPGWDLDEVPEDWFLRNVTADDVLNAMIRYAGSVPPPFAGALGPSFVGKLCRLPLTNGDVWGCPDTPGAPPGQAPGENPPGDHR